ncbi:MAG: nitrilase-related carbon-nitrogen hydrolase [Leptospiraceae bacterium]|nr:nitrilase-related carbon-nitrogen hydrolase [Leptospiraceae bacterium]
MDYLKISAVQLDSVWENKKENFLKLNKMVESLQGRDLIVLPETFATGFTMKSEEFAEERFGETETFLQEFAEKTNAYVIGGWIEKNPNGKPYNTLTVFSPDSIVMRYRKIHPFSFGHEDRHFTRGNSVEVFLLKGLNICPLICYDIRFPETFRKTVGKTDLYIVIASWPSPRVQHWLSLLKARAIENQSFVLGVNRVGIAGRIKKLYHNGYTAFFNPLFEEKILNSEKEDILEISVSKDELMEIRKNFPYLQDIVDI